MRMYAFLLNHMQEHKHCECRSREFHATFWIAWELGLRSAPLSSRHPQEDGLDVVGGRSSLLWGGWVADDDLEREGGWNERLGMTWLMALAHF